MGKKDGRKKRKKSKPSQTRIEGDQVHGGKRIIHAGGSYFEEKVEVSNGNLVGRDQVILDSSSRIQTLFQPIYHAIASRPDTTEAERHEIEAHVKEIEAEAKKGEQADEGFLIKRLHNLENMAPDIWAVVLATLKSPLEGFSTIVRKVVKKISGEKKPEESSDKSE